MPVSQLQTEEIKWISPKNRFELYTVWEGAKYYFYFFFCHIAPPSFLFSGGKQMPAASKNLLRSAIQYLLIVVKQGTVHHIPFGIGRIHDHAIPGIDSHMRDVHVSSVWFVAPEHKVPRLQ